jgi:hypothetical protein
MTHRCGQLTADRTRCGHKIGSKGRCAAGHRITVLAAPSTPPAGHAGTDPLAARPETADVAEILTSWRPGDQPTWDDVRDYITTEHTELMERLTESVAAHGVVDPVQIDRSVNPPRVKNGHHRLLAAEAAGLDRVPVADWPGYDHNPQIGWYDLDAGEFVMEDDDQVETGRRRVVPPPAAG